MFWFPVLAAGATVAIVGKALARHFKGQLAHSAVHDPEGVRTVARFEANPEAIGHVLHSVAGSLATFVDQPLEVDHDAIRGQSRHHMVDIVRLARCDGGTFTLTLTRAWTGPQLDGRAYELLHLIHDALQRTGVRGLTWHARQDRELATPFPHPHY